MEEEVGGEVEGGEVEGREVKGGWRKRAGTCF